MVWERGFTVFYCCISLTDFLSTEEADVAGPSDLIMTRGNLNEEDEEVDSDTDDIDHSGEKRNYGQLFIHCEKTQIYTFKKDKYISKQMIK